MGKNSYFGAIVLAVIAALLFVAGPTALAEGADQVAVGNEPIAVDYDNETAVDEAGITYDESVTVRNGGGDVLDEGTDYEWDAATGNVTWLDSLSTSDGGTAAITYTATQPTQESRRIAGAASILGVALGIASIWIVGAAAIGGVL